MSRRGLVKAAAPVRPQILFVHDRFPGQFGALSAWLAGQGWDVWFATAGARPPLTNPGVRVVTYKPHRSPSPETHPYVQAMDRSALTGQACLRICLEAHASGLAPDLIVSHTGPGAGLYLADAFPAATQIAYCEWWYNAPGVDTVWLAKQAGQPVILSPEEKILEHSRNLPIQTELFAADVGLCPTRFQAAQFPDPLFRMLHVEHDGVDCHRFKPGPLGRPRNAALRDLPEDGRIVTYATRGMEPHRGFPQVMEACAAVQATDQHVHTVIAGKNGVHYGGDEIRGIDWKAHALEQAGLVPERTHFTGLLGQDDYLWLLRRSDAHVYATAPFVLSWSMLEAMACSAPLVLSDTAPVREFADPECARLADLSAPKALAEAIQEVLADPVAASIRAKTARARVVENWSQARLFTRKERWLASLA